METSRIMEKKLDKEEDPSNAMPFECIAIVLGPFRHKQQLLRNVQKM